MASALRALTPHEDAKVGNLVYVCKTFDADVLYVEQKKSQVVV